MPLTASMKIESGEVLIWEYVRVPRESPVGIIDSAVLQLIVRGRTLHCMEKSPNLQSMWMDIDTGELVAIDFPTEAPNAANP